MPISFKYTAVNAIGRNVRGKLMAENELDLESRLKQSDLDLVDYREIKERKASFFSRVSARNLIIMCLTLEQLCKAGVPLHEALQDMRDSTESRKLKDILTDVCENVKNGSMLSSALAAHPKVFNEIFIGLVAAGEKTGNLGEAFHHLVEHMKWVSEIRRKIKKATRYPMALMAVLSLVITTLMVNVVPKLTDFILNQGFDVPIHTRALIWVSHAFVDYWFLVGGIPIIVLFTLFTLRMTSEGFCYHTDALFLHVPVIGTVIRKIELARFTHFFATMFNSGIDILESLSAAKKVVKNRIIRESIETVRINITEGSGLTAALRASTHFPTLVIRMFKVGEDSGNMKDALENINFFYDREVNDAVDTMVGMVQPTLTVVMGLVIFWVVAAVFGPLYESFGKMKF